MFLSPGALGAVVSRSTVAVEKGGKRRRLNPPLSNFFSLPAPLLSPPISTTRQLFRSPPPPTTPYCLPVLPDPPRFDAMESDLSPDDAAKCTSGVLHLSSKRSMQHRHYWVINKRILPSVTKKFRFHKVTNPGGFDFISFTPYASEDTYKQLHTYDAPLESACLYAKLGAEGQEEQPAVKWNGNSVSSSGIMVSAFCLPALLSFHIDMSLALSLSLSYREKETQTKGFILATHPIVVCSVYFFGAFICDQLFFYGFVWSIDCSPRCGCCSCYWRDRGYSC